MPVDITLHLRARTSPTGQPDELCSRAAALIELQRLTNTDLHQHTLLLAAALDAVLHRTDHPASRPFATAVLDDHNSNYQPHQEQTNHADRY